MVEVGDSTFLNNTKDSNMNYQLEIIEKAKGLSFKNGMAVGILIGGVVVSLVISVVKV